MQTKDFAIRLVVPFILLILLTIPVFTVELLLGWSNGALGMSVIAIGSVFAFVEEPVVASLWQRLDARRSRHAAGRGA